MDYTHDKNTKFNLVQGVGQCSVGQCRVQCRVVQGVGSVVQSMQCRVCSVQCRAQCRVQGIYTWSYPFQKIKHKSKNTNTQQQIINHDHCLFYFAAIMCVGCVVQGRVVQGVQCRVQCSVGYVVYSVVQCRVCSVGCIQYIVGAGLQHITF